MLLAAGVVDNGLLVLEHTRTYHEVQGMTHNLDDRSRCGAKYPQAAGGDVSARMYGKAELPNAIYAIGDAFLLTRQVHAQ